MDDKTKTPVDPATPVVPADVPTTPTPDPAAPAVDDTTPTPAPAGDTGSSTSDPVADIKMPGEAKDTPADPAAPAADAGVTTPATPPVEDKPAV